MEEKVEEKVYILDNYEEMILLEDVFYNGVKYMLLKDSTKPEVKIGYEYDSKIYYINKESDGYDIISAMLLEKLKKELNNA